MQLVEKKALTVVGVQVVANWEGLHQEMPKHWQVFKGRLVEVSHRVSDVMMDISLQVEDGLYTQLICVEVEGDGQVPEGMMQIEIPKQTYIYHRHEGSLPEIAQSFGAILNWAAENRYEAEALKIDAGYLQNGLETGHDLYVKIKK